MTKKSSQWKNQLHFLDISKGNLVYSIQCVRVGLEYLYELTQLDSINERNKGSSFWEFLNYSKQPLLKKKSSPYVGIISPSKIRNRRIHFFFLFLKTKKEYNSSLWKNKYFLFYFFHMKTKIKTFIPWKRITFVFVVTFMTYDKKK